MSLSISSEISNSAIALFTVKFAITGIAGQSSSGVMFECGQECCNYSNKQMQMLLLSRSEHGPHKGSDFWYMSG